MQAQLSRYIKEFHCNYGLSKPMPQQQAIIQPQRKLTQETSALSFDGRQRQTSD
jgi:hypothetical protein